MSTLMPHAPLHMPTDPVCYNIVGAQGLQVDPKKIAVVKDCPVPNDRAQLQKFWGLENYIKKFVVAHMS